MIKNYFLHKRRLKLLRKYRNENFKNVTRLIEAHNVIVNHPSEVRVSIMGDFKKKVDEAIVFYQGEKIYIGETVSEYNNLNLNRRGIHYRECLMVLLGDMDNIIDTLNEVREGITEEMNKKQQTKEKIKGAMCELI